MHFNRCHHNMALGWMMLRQLIADTDQRTLSKPFLGHLGLVVIKIAVKDT